MSFEWFVARRYLTARRKQAFISLISGVSILGVGVGVMALIIALALMTGVQGELRDRIVGSTAHVYVYKLFDNTFNDVEGELRRFSAVRTVTGAAPAIIGQGLITSNASSLPEVVDDAALMVAPEDERALAEAIVRAVTDRALREEMIARGLTQARKFSWARAARETAALYREVLHAEE